MYLFNLLRSKAQKPGRTRVQIWVREFQPRGVNAPTSIFIPLEFSLEVRGPVLRGVAAPLPPRGVVAERGAAAARGVLTAEAQGVPTGTLGCVVRLGDRVLMLPGGTDTSGCDSGPTGTFGDCLRA